MITNNTYHQKGRYFIPNSNEVEVRPEGVESSLTSLDYFIDVYERELLIGFLDIELYNELVAVFPNIEGVGNEKWFNLVNGTDYVYDGKTYRFEGLRGYNKNSMISAYVFCKYLRNDDSYYSTTGVLKVNGGNSTPFDPTQKYVTAWLDFLSKYQDNYHYSNSSYSVIYKNGIPVGLDYYKEEENKSGLVTLETYLKHNENNFEGYKFTRYETINSFNI